MPPQIWVLNTPFSLHAYMYVSGLFDLLSHTDCEVMDLTDTHSQTNLRDISENLRAILLRAQRRFCLTLPTTNHRNFSVRTSLLHLMCAIACSHVCTRGTSLMRVKPSMRYFCLWHLLSVTLERRK